jgi:hypothetical protein
MGQTRGNDRGWDFIRPQDLGDRLAGLAGMCWSWHGVGLWMGVGGLLLKIRGFFQLPLASLYVLSVVITKLYQFGSADCF